MNHTAHKSAQRSASKDESRAEFKRRPWNNMPMALTRQTLHTDQSWWTAASSPDARDRFIALARERNQTKWAAVGPHADNPSKGYS